MKKSLLNNRGRIIVMGSHFRLRKLWRGSRTNPMADELHKMLSCIGERVSFKYSGNEESKYGILKDWVVVESTNESGVVPYWDVVDLIEFKD